MGGSEWTFAEVAFEGVRARKVRAEREGELRRRQSRGKVRVQHMLLRSCDNVCNSNPATMDGRGSEAQDGGAVGSTSAKDGAVGVAGGSGKEGGACLKLMCATACITQRECRTRYAYSEFKMRSHIDEWCSSMFACVGDPTLPSIKHKH